MKVYWILRNSITVLNAHVDSALEHLKPTDPDSSKEGRYRSLSGALEAASETERQDQLRDVETRYVEILERARQEAVSTATADDSLSKDDQVLVEIIHAYGGACIHMVQTVARYAIGSSAGNVENKKPPIE